MKRGFKVTHSLKTWLWEALFSNKYLNGLGIITDLDWYFSKLTKIFPRICHCAPCVQIWQKIQKRSVLNGRLEILNRYGKCELKPNKMEIILTSLTSVINISFICSQKMKINLLMSCFVVFSGWPLNTFHILLMVRPKSSLGNYLGSTLSLMAQLTKQRTFLLTSDHQTGFSR